MQFSQVRRVNEIEHKITETDGVGYTILTVLHLLDGPRVCIPCLSDNILILYYSSPDVCELTGRSKGADSQPSRSNLEGSFVRWRGRRSAL